MSIEQLVGKLLSPIRLNVVRIRVFELGEPVPEVDAPANVTVIDRTGRKANAGHRPPVRRNYLTTGESDFE